MNNLPNMMENFTPYNYLVMLQTQISRFAQNSFQMKSWAITVIAALVALLDKSSHPNYRAEILFPIAIFYLLDVYYLSLEQATIDLYEDMLTKIEHGTVKVSDLFKMRPKGKELSKEALRSASTWPFYSVLLILGIINFFSGS